MENIGDIEASVEANFTGASTNAFTKASMEVMKAFAEVVEASMEVEATSMEA